jgi:hypothetical protein
LSVPLIILGLSLLAGKPAAPAKPDSIRYTPPADAPEERPLPTEINASLQGSGYAVRITFNRVPWGDQCKNRCANVTIFLDTDNDKLTGIQLGKDKPETGADLAVTVQGTREYKEKSAEALLRARVRHLPDNSNTLEAGTVLAEMDHQHDPDKIQLDGNHVFVLVDATNISIPSGKVLRVVYHPPADKPLELTTKGILGGGQTINPFEKKKPKKKKYDILPEYQ